MMMRIRKKIVIDEQGKPHEVIIPSDEFQEIIDLLGLDLDEEAIADLNQGRADRASGNLNAYIDLDDV